MNTVDYNSVFEIESSPISDDENQNSEIFPEWQAWGKHRQPEMYAEREKNAFLYPRKDSEIDPENTENDLEKEVKHFRPKKPYLKAKHKHKLLKPPQKIFLKKNETHQKSNNEEDKFFTDAASAKNNTSDYNENTNKSKSEEEIENFLNEAYVTEDSSNYSSESFTSVHSNKQSIKKPKSQKQNYKSKNKHLKNSNYLHGPNLRHKERRNPFRFKKFHKSFYAPPAILKFKINNENRRNLKSSIKKIASIFNFHNSQNKNHQPHRKEKNLRPHHDFQDSSLDLNPFRANTEEQEFLNRNLHPKFPNPNSLKNSKDVLGVKGENPGNHIREYVRSQLLPLNSNALDSQNSKDTYIALDKSHSALTIMPTANENGKVLKKIAKKAEQENPIEVMQKDLYAAPSSINIYDKNVREIPSATEEYGDTYKIEMKSMPKVYLRSVKDFMPYFRYNRNLNLPPGKNQQLHFYQKYPNNEEEQFINSIASINQNKRNLNKNYLESSNNNNRHEKSLPDGFKITQDNLDIPQVKNLDDKLNLVKKLSKILEDFKVKEIILSDPKANRETNVIEDRKQNFVDNIRVFNTAHEKLQPNELSKLRLSTSEKQAITEVPKPFSDTFTQNENFITSDSMFSHETEYLNEEKTGQKYPVVEADPSMYITFSEDLEEVTSPFDSTEESFQVQSEKGQMEYDNYQGDLSLESSSENQDYYFNDMDENRNSKNDSTNEDYDNKEHYDYNTDYDSSLYFQDDSNVVTPPMHPLNDQMPEHQKNRLHPSSQDLPKDGLHKTNFKIPDGSGSIQTKFYHFSTEISALGDGDEFQKEEMIEKESKTMLRNKLMSSNESSHQFEEKKTEIKDNKENYHEAFIQEKDHNKYPNKPDIDDNRNFNIEERSIGSTESQDKTNLIRKSIISDEKVPNWDHKLGKNHLEMEDKPIHSEKREYLKSYPSQRENDFIDNVFKFSKNFKHRASPVDFYEYVTDEYEFYPENASDNDTTEQEKFNKRNDDNRNPSSTEIHNLKLSRDTSNNSYANQTANDTDRISTTTVQQQNITTTTELAKVSTETKSETVPSRSKKSYQEFKFNEQSNGSVSLKKRRNPDNFQEAGGISSLMMRSTESSELQDVNAALLLLNSMDKDKNILKKRDEEGIVTTYHPKAENRTKKQLNLSNSGNVVYITISTTTMDLERRFNDFVQILEKKRSSRRSQRYPKNHNGKGRKRLVTEKWTHFKS
ncbi:uncharacterized protein TNCT_611851 [Trichonephila clavata]|uniref:Uncharacterized protein n=1 Tax=Trichonephila clavata TaxID=2740835 RepID=A0A8X6M3E3_TRICU|nr:uncharacterized protein TNCT_611851 [Trichonephila clavata]